MFGIPILPTVSRTILHVISHFLFLEFVIGLVLGVDLNNFCVVVVVRRLLLRVVVVS